MKTWSAVWNGIRKALIMKETEETAEPPDEVKLIQIAGEEVAAARNIYSEIDDPDMVDWAVYKLTAAEKRYDCLLKKYRQKT
ncbi:MAG: hypothetical protein VB084_07140 [Syntrophomonadaceae bacterium]|nr:hypothetical protein [Syntrophomonadaceae bacterium]